jgi:hypothetical protein
MNLIPVVSSNLCSVGYDGAGTLVIAFHGGRMYQYSGVPGAIYTGLMNASSHGKYFHAWIGNQYPYRRIT